MVPPDSDRIPRVPSYSGISYVSQVFVYGAITHYGLTFQSVPLTFKIDVTDPTTPKRKIFLVWANPISLATTIGISVDLYSFRYLDVSVP